MLQQTDTPFIYKPADFARAQQLLYRQTGINLSTSKTQMVYSRLARRLRALGLHDFSRYLNLVETDKEEREEFVNALTTNLTSFFREPHHFEMLARYAEPLAAAGRRLRVWCAASSTGEEAYSIAMTLVQVYRHCPPPVELIASDIDSRVLQQARSGIYALPLLDKMDAALKRQFFQRGKGGMKGQARILPQIRDWVEFRQINLLDASWPLKGPFDVIFCRNVMIYFDKPTQHKLFERMLGHLVEGGLYMAGHSESFTQSGYPVRLVGKTTYQKATTEQGALNRADR